VAADDIDVAEVPRERRRLGPHLHGEVGQLRAETRMRLLWLSQLWNDRCAVLLAAAKVAAVFSLSLLSLSLLAFGMSRMLGLDLAFP
jgi:hypothetical protein